MTTVVLGFDPGGEKQFGWCVASGAADGKLVLRSNGTASHAAGAVEMALREAQKCGVIAAAAIDSPLFWNLSGDRRADMTVRAAMRRIGAVNLGGTVQHVNSLRGACLAQGMMAAHILRDKMPSLRLTESHPKALLWLLEVATPQRPVREIRIDHLDKFIQCDSSALCEHERDAAVGAFAAWAMLNQRSGWRNLYTDEDGVFAPVSPIEYWMPIGRA